MSRQDIKNIIMGIINLDDDFVLDGKYIRWGKVEGLLVSMVEEKETEINQLHAELEQARERIKELERLAR